MKQWISLCLSFGLGLVIGILVLPVLAHLHGPPTPLPLVDAHGRLINN